MVFSSKRGVNADMFAWFFGLAAGAVVFLFLIRFGYQHIGLSGELDERQSVEYLQDHLEALTSVDLSSKIIDFHHEVPFFFSCETVGTGSYGKMFNNILFAPPLLEGSTISVWTARWSYPFPITNVFYLTNSRQTTVVVYDSAHEDLVTSFDFPDTMHVLLVHSTSFSLATLHQLATTADRIVMVLFAPLDPTPYLTVSRVPVHIVRVDTDTSRLTYINTNTESFYLGDELLFGALFAPEQYDCSLSLALERLQRVSSVYSQKAALLMKKTDSQVCTSRLFTLSQTLAEFGRTRNPDELLRLHDALLTQQRDLHSYNCPVVFS